MQSLVGKMGCKMVLHKGNDTYIEYIKKYKRITLLASSELINSSIIKDQLWWPKAEFHLTGLWLLRWIKRVIMSHITTQWWDKKASSQSPTISPPFSSVKQLVLTLSWCYFKNLPHSGRGKGHHVIKRKDLQKQKLLESTWWGFLEFVAALI